MKEILSSLCVYDNRNPDCIYDPEDIQDHENDIKKGKTCYCDNCFHGRTETAISMINMPM